MQNTGPIQPADGKLFGSARHPGQARSNGLRLGWRGFCGACAHHALGLLAVLAGLSGSWAGLLSFKENEQYQSRIHALWEVEDFAALEQEWESACAAPMVACDPWPAIKLFHLGLLTGLNEISEEEAGQREERYGRWLAAHPNSPIARIALANFYSSRGWLARGTKWASEVDPAAWPVFFSRLGQARDLLYAEGISPAADPTVGELRIFLEMAGVRPPGADLPDPDQVLALNRGPIRVDPQRPAESISSRVRRHGDETHSHWPNFLPVHEAAVGAMLPRWGGSLEAIADYAAAAAGRHAGKSGDGVYARLMERVIDIEEEVFFTAGDFDLARMVRGCDVLRAHFAREYHDFLEHRAAFVAVRAGMLEDARRRLLDIGPRAVLQAYLNSRAKRNEALETAGVIAVLEQGAALEKAGEIEAAREYYAGLSSRSPNLWLAAFAARNGVVTDWLPHHAKPAHDLPADKARGNELFELTNFHLAAGNLNEAKSYAEAFDRERGHNITGKMALAWVALLEGNDDDLDAVRNRVLEMKTNRKNYLLTKEFIAGETPWEDLRDQFQPDGYQIQSLQLMIPFALKMNQDQEAKQMVDTIRACGGPFSQDVAGAESLLFGALQRKFPSLQTAFTDPQREVE